MSYADQVYLENLVKLTEQGGWDENPRPHYKDGEIAYSKFISDTYVKYPEHITPIISLRHVPWKTGIQEIIAIYQKQTSNIKELDDLKVGWWSDWCINPEANYEDREIGRRYGATVKKWDLMNKLLDGLVNDPYSRRHIIDLYQYADLEETEGLHPCAFLTAWTCRKVGEDMYLDLALMQRSSDYGTAYSLNQTQYKAFQMMVACHCGYKVGTFSHHVMNLHVYDRHGDEMARLAVAPKQQDEPELVLNTPPGTNFYDIKLEDFEMRNYKPFKHEPKLFFELAI